LLLSALQSHGRACDWWSLGVLAFELLFGRPAFSFGHGTDAAHPPAAPRTPKQIFASVLRYCQDAHLGRDVDHVFLPCRSDAQRAFLRMLLEPDPRARGGYGAQHGGHDVFVGSAFLADFDWGALVRQELAPPTFPPEQPEAAEAAGGAGLKIET